MPQISFEVAKYTIDKLLSLLASKSNISIDVVQSKFHAKYFKSYFDELQARTIVIENGYIDRDYLEDYAAYYARCFREYPRQCTRLHFFNKNFTHKCFADLLRNAKSSLTIESLQESYLGFIVIRPLPLTIVGRTCLKTYDTNGDRRHFPVVREYKVNLYGIELPIKSIAFQEQDRAVSACATSALWSAFHRTGMLFQHAIPSPVEITQSANTQFPLASRGLPSSGLNAEQMAGGIRSVGLEPYLIEVSDQEVLRNVTYAYVSGGIPAILVFKLFRTENNQSREMGMHAVTVTGFSLRSSNDEPTKQVAFKATRIDKLYVHDDQVGPFARMKLDGVTLPDKNIHSIATAWSDCHRAVPEFVLIPLYHKIRIPFESVYEAVGIFALSVAAFSNAQTFPYPDDIEWDVFLTTVNNFRSNLLETSILTGDRAERVLCDRFPRFMWRATARTNELPMFDLLFDATDIEQGRFFHRAVEYDPGISAYLRHVLNHQNIEKTIKNTLAWQIVDWFRKNPA